MGVLPKPLSDYLVSLILPKQMGFIRVTNWSCRLYAKWCTFLNLQSLYILMQMLNSSRTKNEQIPLEQNEGAGSRPGVFTSCRAATCSTWQDWLLSVTRLIPLYTLHCALDPPLKCDVIVAALFFACQQFLETWRGFFFLDNGIWGWEWNTMIWDKIWRQQRCSMLLLWW